MRQYLLDLVVGRLRDTFIRKNVNAEVLCETVGDYDVFTIQVKLRSGYTDSKSLYPEEIVKTIIG